MRIGCTCDRGLEAPDLRGVKYDKSIHCPACWAFWHRPEINLGRGGTGAVPVRLAPTVVQTYSDCAYKGKPTGQVEQCQTCTGKKMVPLYVCEKLGGTCFTGGYTVPSSRSCNQCSHKTRKREEDYPAAVVIGSYGWPSLTEMHIKLIRRTCGEHVPILFVDDCSPEYQKRLELCKKYKVSCMKTPERFGHVGGDLCSIKYGLKFAEQWGARVLCKLSQRVFLTRPRWLQDGARELVESTFATGTRKAIGPHTSKYPIRSEVMLLDVTKWDHESIPERAWNPHIASGQPHINGETLILSLAPERVVWPWSEIVDRRVLPRPHEINHWNSTREDYERLAKELNVTLDPTFHANGWEKELAEGTYLYG